MLYKVSLHNRFFEEDENSQDLEFYFNDYEEAQSFGGIAIKYGDNIKLTIEIVKRNETRGAENG